MGRYFLILFLVFGIVILGCDKKETDPCKNEEYPKVMKDKTIADFNRGDLYTALTDINEVKRCSPRDPEVYYWLCRIYIARQEKGKAKENCEIALKYRTDYPEANMALGMMLLEEGKYPEALESFKKAAKDDLYREAYIAWNNIGYIYIQMDKFAEAEEALHRSIILSPYPYSCLAESNLGELRSRQKRYSEAIKGYQKAIELCPDLARAHRLLGLEYNRQGRIKDACREFELTLKYALGGEEAKSAGEYFKLLNCSPTLTK